MSCPLYPIPMPNMTDPEKAPLLEPDQLSGCEQSLHPGNEPTRPPRSASSKLWVLFAVLVLSKSAIVLGLLAHRSWTSGASADLSGICVQPAPGKPSNWTGLYEYDGFAKESAERLSGAVRIPTQ